MITSSLSESLIKLVFHPGMNDWPRGRQQEKLNQITFELKKKNQNRNIITSISTTIPKLTNDHATRLFSFRLESHRVGFCGFRRWLRTTTKNDGMLGRWRRLLEPRLLKQKTSCFDYPNSQLTKDISWEMPIICDSRDRAEKCPNRVKWDENSLHCDDLLDSRVSCHSEQILLELRSYMILNTFSNKEQWRGTREQQQRYGRMGTKYERCGSCEAKGLCTQGRWLKLWISNYQLKDTHDQCSCPYWCSQLLTNPAYTRWRSVGGDVRRWEFHVHA